MFCSSCGIVAAQGLYFCKNCGARLSSGEGDDAVTDHFSLSREVKPEFLVSAMVVCFALGLIAITMLMGVMKAVLNFNAGPIFAFTMLSFLMLIVIEGVFIRLLMRRKANAPETTGKTVGPKGTATKELDAAHARGLQEPVASVTEHTTRTFDPIYNERISK